jgi:hypothetical protein
MAAPARGAAEVRHEAVLATGGRGRQQRCQHWHRRDEVEQRRQVRELLELLAALLARLEVRLVRRSLLGLERAQHVHADLLDLGAVQLGRRAHGVTPASSRSSRRLRSA